MPAALMKKTPLYERHIALGGRIIDFGGWAMPVQYDTVMAEHERTRQAAGLFDTCHMGEVEIRGEGAFSFLQRVLTRDLADQRPGQMRLSLMTNERGGILDDLTVYMLSGDRYLIVTNAATKDKDLQWLLKIRDEGGFGDVVIEDVTATTGKVDLQGPKAEEILQVLVPHYLHTLKFYHFLETTILGMPALVSRSGYTGEDGFEIYVPAEGIGRVWDRLLQVGGDYGLKAAGLGARDTLRLEAGLMLYGNELDEDVIPFEVVYGWITNLEKDFVGRDALRRRYEKGVERKLAGFICRGRGIARKGHGVMKDGREVGVVTSGTYSPTLGKAIGLAFVPPGLAVAGTVLDIVVRQNVIPAQVVDLPFYRRKRQYYFFNLFI